MRHFHDVNSEILLDFEIPGILKELMMEAEEADSSGNVGYYLNLADTIDVCAKNLYADGFLSNKQWELICRRYPQ